MSLNTNKLLFPLLIFLLCLVFGLFNPVFLSFENILNIFNQISIIGIVALGMTVVIIIGGIDLSVGSTVAITGLAYTLLLTNELAILPSVIISLILGIFIGIINGSIISYGKVPAFITTLGMMSAIRGLALFLTDGRAISNLPKEISYLTNNNFLSIPLTVIVFLIILVFLWLFLNFTYWGKYLYAIGGNDKAAWLSGINVNAYTILAYGICGLCCSIASIILVSKLNSAQPQAGTLYELNSIAAVVLGGASLTGGKGNVLNTFWGIIVIGILQNGLSILNVSSYYQQIIIGLIIIVAVIIEKKSLTINQTTS